MDNVGEEWAEGGKLSLVYLVSSQLIISNTSSFILAGAIRRCDSGKCFQRFPSLTILDGNKR